MEIINYFKISLYWAILDTKCRYRRSIIGSFWETISALVLIVGISLIYTAVVGAGNTLSNMAYIGLGIIFWNAISGLINESSEVFIFNSHHILGSSLPLKIMSGRLICNNFITLSHQMILYLIGLFFLPIKISFTILFFPLGVSLFYLNACWITIVLGILCARFRDLGQIIKNIVQLFFFVTPIFWNPAVLESKRQFITDYNIFFHFLVILRDPLLGNIPDLKSYAVVLMTALLGFAILSFVNNKLGKNIALYL